MASQEQVLIRVPVAQAQEMHHLVGEDAVGCGGRPVGLVAVGAVVNDHLGVRRRRVELHPDVELVPVHEAVTLVDVLTEDLGDPILHLVHLLGTHAGARLKLQADGELAHPQAGRQLDTAYVMTDQRHGTGNPAPRGNGIRRRLEPLGIDPSDRSLGSPVIPLLRTSQSLAERLLRALRTERSAADGRPRRPRSTRPPPTAVIPVSALPIGVTTLAVLGSRLPQFDYPVPNLARMGGA